MCVGVDEYVVFDYGVEFVCVVVVVGDCVSVDVYVCVDVGVVDVCEVVCF